MYAKIAIKFNARKFIELKNRKEVKGTSVILLELGKGTVSIVNCYT